MELPDDTSGQLDHLLATSQRTDRLPSVVAAVTRGDTTLWVGAAGLVDGTVPTPNTQYRIGSITKTFIAVAIMQLRDAGALTLADDVTDHLDQDWRSASDGLRGIRIGQLLMHTAGLGSETTGPWWERAAGGDATTLADELAVRTHPHVAGSRFHYSNVGFGILGAVLTHHHGADWTTVVARDILTPLGMTRTTSRPVAPFAPGLAVHPWADMVLREPEHDAGAMAPAGQLWSTVTDLVRWVSFLARSSGSSDAHAAVLGLATLAEMTVPGAVADTPGAAWTIAHGLGIQVFNTGGTIWIGHGGSMPGFLATIRVCPSSGLGIIVASNTTAGLDATLADRIVDVADRALPADIDPWVPTEPPAQAAGLLGIWYWGPRLLRLSCSGRTLHLAPVEGHGRASDFVLVDDGDGGDPRWVGTQGYYAGEELAPVRADDGAITHLDLASFVLSRGPYDDDATAPGGVDAAGWHVG